MNLRSLPQKLIINQVNVWNGFGVEEAVDVKVENGLVAAIDRNLPKDTSDHQIDGRGLALIPMGIDPQVHLRVPGQSQKEEPETGVRAALAGGVGAVLTMPNTKPVIDCVEVLEQARAQLEAACQKYDVDVYFSAAISKNLAGKEAVNFKNLIDAGVRAFTDDGLGVDSDEIMRHALAASADFDIPLLQHAEFLGHKGVLAPGTVQASLNVAPYPESAEVDMVARDLRLLADFPGARYHVLHISSAKTIQLLEDAKSRGLRVSGEVSPHHLLFCCEDIDQKNPAFKMNPPLRSAEDRAALRNALFSGAIDFVATDHAPHEAEVKTANFKTAAYGTTGLEAMLRVLVKFYQERSLSAERLVSAFSHNAAHFLGIEEQWGHLSPNRPFRALLIDPKGSARPLALEDLHSKSKNSCFLGAQLPEPLVTGFTPRLMVDYRAH